MWSSALFFGLILLFPTGARASESMKKAYLITWGYQASPNIPTLSHTFGTFFLMKGDRLERKVDISWLPAPGFFTGSSGLELPMWEEVPGWNYDLKETLSFAEKLGEPVARFGPYETTLDLFERAVKHLAVLQTGRTQYKMIDLWRRPQAVNCIHAVSDVGGTIRSGPLYGNEASRYLIDAFRKRGFVTGPSPDDELFTRIENDLLPD